MTEQSLSIRRGMLEGCIATADADALELVLLSASTITRMSSPCTRAVRIILIKGQGHEDGQIIVAIQAGPGEAGGVGIDPEPAHYETAGRLRACSGVPKAPSPFLSPFPIAFSLFSLLSMRYDPCTRSYVGAAGTKAAFVSNLLYSTPPAAVQQPNEGYTTTNKR